MSQRARSPFQKRLLAVCVAALCTSLGACSAVPSDDGFGGTMARTGEATRVAGARLWSGTRHLLGFTDDAETGLPTADAAGNGGLDEVDLALLEEDAALPDATDVVRSDVWSDIAAASDAADGTPTERLVDEAAFDAEQDALTTAGSEAARVPSDGMTHEVGAGETLWDVAKMTTGDATNWHVLADINDLAPDAAVYPGQTIEIPPDLVRPELAGLATTGDRLADDTTGDPAATERLVVPGADDAGERLAAGVTDLVDGRVDELVDGQVEPSARLDDDAAEAASGDVAPVDLDPGETLWDFAKRTTGDATNWRAIAAANDFSEERATKVRPGESIAVPTAMLKPAFGGELSAPTAAEAPTETAEVDAAERASDEMVPIADAADLLEETPDDLGDAGDALASEASDGTDTLVADASDLTDEPVRIVEAAYRGEPATVGAAQPAADSLPGEIMVSGTYYPKAVYNDADFSSSLLMRVSPGTTLQVSRAVGPWYEVNTAQGTGYVHTRDIK